MAGLKIVLLGGPAALPEFLVRSAQGRGDSGCARRSGCHVSHEAMFLDPVIVRFCGAEKVEYLFEFFNRGNIKTI